MRKLSCGKDLQSRTSQLGSDTIWIWESHTFSSSQSVCLSFFSASCTICMFFSGVKTLSWYWKENRVAKRKRSEERVSSPWRKGNHAKMQKTTNSWIFIFVVNISMRKMILEVEYFDLSNKKNFHWITYYISRWS